MNRESPVEYIDTAAALQAFCTRLSRPEWIAIDTEFLREKTYYPKLCLLQVATPQTVACIDPLALEDLTPLLDLIFDPAVTKVMHAARQDLEILYHLRGTVPAPVFDTQIAALLLGHPDQIGYGNLVREVLGIDLEKLHTRADWSMRPLTQEQLKYAADDVIYLVDVYQRIHNQLEELGRLEWLAEDFERLTSPDLYHSPPEKAWLRVKGGNRLRGASLSILQALAGWREALARSRDIPRGWLLRDEVLVDMARHKPGTLDALGGIRGISQGLVKRDGNTLLELIGTAAARPPEPFPQRGERRRLTPAQDAVVDVMMALVRMSGAANALNPAVLATRKQLESLVSGDGDPEVMHGWRRELVGNRLRALLDGELSLSVRDGQLQF